ncbi:hypothetical protein GUITHDRAFT_60925, partial [Guillardia theta CCMP2712]
WGLASAASLPAGALVAIIKSPPDKMSANLMSFGGGALLFALSIELFGDEKLKNPSKRPSTSVEAARASVETPELPNQILEENEMAEAVAEDLSKDKNVALMIWLGILIDAIPESMVIGFIVAEGSRNPLVFVIGVFLSNFPEAMASANTMKHVGLNTVTILLLWTSTCVITGLGAMFGAAIMPSSGLSGDFELFVKAMEGLAAGAMLTMIAQTMLPEACEKGGALTGIFCSCGFLSALLAKL